MVRRPPIPRRTALLALAAAALLAGALIAILTIPGRLGHRPERARGLTSTRAGASTLGDGRVRGGSRRQLPTALELTLASRYLGLGTSQLRASLRAGTSLEEIATRECGHSRVGLLAALVNARLKFIERERARGTLGAARAQRRLARIRTRAEEAIARRGS